MSRSSLVLLVVSFLGCTPPAPRITPGTCANEVCTEAQRCDGPTLRCVTNELPKVMLVGEFMGMEAATTSAQIPSAAACKSGTGKRTPRVIREAGTDGEPERGDGILSVWRLKFGVWR